MQGQLRGITKQAEIMSDQRQAMLTEIDTMILQANIMKQALDETKTLVGHNERVAKAAEDSVRVAQENTFHAQRAYVCVTKASMVENKFSLLIENAGNTPANEAQLVCRAEVLAQDPDPKLAAYSPERHFSAFGVIAPHSHFQKLKAIDGGFSGEDQRKMQAGWQLYCHGKIWYKDVFGKPHNTYFCFSQRLNTQFIGPCIEGNEAD